MYPKYRCGKNISDLCAHSHFDSMYYLFQVYVDPGGFCQGSTGVSMYMEGFISYVTGEYRTEGGSKTPSCLVLWFPDWILDTQGKNDF